MVRRFLVLAAFLTVTAALPLLPEGDAQQRMCPRGVQINQMQVRSQQQFNYQQQARQVQQQQQQQFQQLSRQVQQPRPQVSVPARPNQPPPTAAARPSTTVTPVNRQVPIRTQTVVNQSRTATTTPAPVPTPPPGLGLGPRATAVPPRPTTVSTTNRTVTNAVTLARTVELVPTTVPAARPGTPVASAGPRQVPQRPATITQESRQVQVASRAIQREAVKLNTRSRSVHETRNITTLTWNMTCMQCHTVPGRINEPVVQTRPQPPSAIRPPAPQPPSPVLTQRPPTPTGIARPPLPFPEPWRFGPALPPTVFVRQPPGVIPTGPAVRFPLTDPRPQQAIQIALLRNRPNTLELWTERPAQRPLLDPLAPATARPVAEPRVQEAITRDFLERPTAPRLPDMLADPVFTGQLREPAHRDAPSAREESTAAAPTYTERDLQAPSLPALPESVLVVRRTSEESLGWRAVDLAPSMAALLDAQEQIPEEMQGPPRATAVPGPARPTSARLVPRDTLAPTLPTLPESVLGPG